MNIYFVGSTVSDFDDFYGGEILGSTGGIESFVDDTDPFQSIRFTGRPNASLFKTLDTTVTGVMYVSFTYAVWDINSSSLDFSLSNDPRASSISLWDGEGNNIFFGGFNVNSGYFEGKVQLRDGTSEDLTIFSNGLMSDEAKVTVRIEPGVGMTFYHNFGEEYSFSGNVGNSASTTNGVKKIGFGNGDTDSFPSFKNFIIADFDTRFADVDFVVVNSTATTDTSSSGNSALTPALVDGYNRTDYENANVLLFDADGEKVIYPENDTITLRDGYEINAVVMSHSAVKTASSPVPTFTPIVEVSGTEYTGSTTTLTEATKYIQSQFTTNPATGVAWTESDLEGLGYGFSLNT